MSTKALQALLGDRIVGYHPILAKIAGGAAEGVLLSQLLYWDGKMETARGRAWDGWFWKVAREIYEETGMTRVEFETARANLVKRGFVEFDTRGVPKRAHYRIHIDAIAAALESAEEFARDHARKIPPKNDAADSAPETDEPLDIEPVVENGHVENRQEVVSKMGAPVCRESANQNAENRQTIQEITSLDSQKIPVPREIPKFSSENLKTCFRRLFHILSDDSWDWLDALVLEIPDEAFIAKHAEYVRAMQSSKLFDRSEFVRTARFRYARYKKALASDEASNGPDSKPEKT